MFIIRIIDDLYFTTVTLSHIKDYSLISQKKALLRTLMLINYLGHLLHA